MDDLILLFTKFGRCAKVITFAQRAIYIRSMRPQRIFPLRARPRGLPAGVGSVPNWCGACRSCSDSLGGRGRVHDEATKGTKNHGRGARATWQRLMCGQM